MVEYIYDVLNFFWTILGASFMLGRCLTSTVWGIAADRIGRKPVVMVGILSVLVNVFAPISID
jgi:MFS family permease